MRVFTIAALAALTTTGAAAADSPRKIHDAAIVLDTHLDTPANLGRPGWSIRDRYRTDRDGDQVDLPRMIEGGVDGGWWVIFTPQGERSVEGLAAARDHALTRAVQIREMVAKHDDAFELALTADDALRIAKARKRIVFMSMENSAPIESGLGMMRLFRSLGVTMMGPVHGRNNGFADSSTDKPEWNGLSPKGRAFVAEANRLGILLDASHASDEATRQILALSAAPIILSHSGMRAVHDHPRNIGDAEAKLVAARGGVIQINVFSAYMIANAPDPAREEALRAVMSRFGAPSGLGKAEKRELIAARRAIDIRFPQRRASIDDVMRHVLHAVRLVGIDHVGLSGDFDGGGGVDGLDDVTDFPKVTAALAKAGFARADIDKFWGGNALRVLRAAQAGAEAGAVPVVPVTL
jgi:membrane dipeptidase